MICNHDIVERKTAIPDGYCPLCQAAEINRLRAALHQIVLMDERRLTGRQKIQQAIAIAEQALAANQ